MSSVARGESGGTLHRLAVQAGGGVVCAGQVTDVFGDGNRAVLSLERAGEQLEELLLLRLRHGLIAVVNRCPHMERPLDDARLRGHVLTCQGHGRSYSLRTGRAPGTASSCPPKLRRFPAWTKDDQVFVDLGGLEAGREDFG